MPKSGMIVGDKPSSVLARVPMCSIFSDWLSVIVKSPVRFDVISPVRSDVISPVRSDVISPVRSPVRFDVISPVRSHVRSNAKRLLIG